VGAAGPARGPRAASGPEELCASERSHGCRRDAMTVSFQSLPQITVDDPQQSNIDQEHTFDNLMLEVRIIVSSVDDQQQQQEQCAGSIGVKTLTPKHTL
jgi:hypothetical protein